MIFSIIIFIAPRKCKFENIFVKSFFVFNENARKLKKKLRKKEKRRIYEMNISISVSESTVMLFIATFTKSEFISELESPFKNDVDDTHVTQSMTLN
jgi:hypothetical protein